MTIDFAYPTFSKREVVPDPIGEEPGRNEPLKDPDSGELPKDEPDEDADHSPKLQTMNF